ncbi:MAG: hypothetical protein WDN06_17460 [Asticcacaulis sp.]
MGFAGKVTRGQVLDPATLIATPPKYTVTGADRHAGGDHLRLRRIRARQ